MKSILESIFNILRIILGLAVIGGLVWGLFVLATGLFSGFSQLPKEVAAGIIATSATVIVSILSLILSKFYERQSETRKEHRDRKIPIYEELIEFFFKFFFSEKAGGASPTEKETIKFLTEFTQRLIIWGSDDVLKSFYVFRDKLVNPGPSDSRFEGLFLFEKLLFAIRKDLGHKNKNIKKGDVLGLFVNDIKKYV